MQLLVSLMVILGVTAGMNISGVSGERDNVRDSVTLAITKGSSDCSY